MTDFPNLHPEEGGAKINNIYTDISPGALGQLVDYITQSGIPIPISQVVGFAQFTAQSASPVTAGENTASTTYVNLTTTGPQVTGLPSGQYLLLYGCAALQATAGDLLMAPSINSATPVDADAALTSTPTASGAVRAVTKTLSLASNTVLAQYRVTGGTGTFKNRWLVALKFANA